MRRQFEYTLISFNTNYYSEDKFDPKLNQLGSQGWEAVGITECKNEWTRILFKRIKE